MLRAKDLKNLDIRYIDPTDEQPNVHPQFFEMTAEEQAEQERIKIREMVKKCLNKGSASDEQIDYIAELIKASITPQNTLAWRDKHIVLDAFCSPRLYGGKSDTVFIDPTDRYCGHWPLTAGIGKLAKKSKCSNENAKEHKKADYKRKFYKNTSKQSKPSPMLMSLVGKTK